LEVDELCPRCKPLLADAVDSVRVFLADTKHPADLPSRLPADSCPEWHWMNVLPSTGVYHIVVSRRLKKRYILRVTLMDPHDPRLDPGITADRVLIGEGSFPGGGTLMLKPYEPFLNGCGVPDFDGFLPAHFRLASEGSWLGIMSLDGLKKAIPSWSDAWSDDIKELKRAVRPGVVAAKPPISGFGDSGLTYWGRLEPFEGESWRGFRWIGQYAQETSELRNPLTYMFAAISKDGKCFIWLWVDTEYLDAPPGLFQLSDEQDTQITDNKKASKAFQQKVNAALTAASPKSFKPDLDQLDAAVRSIELH